MSQRRAAQAGGWAATCDLTMKRKALYSVIILGFIAIGSLWYFPAHIWSSRLLDGTSGGGFGPSGRGVGFSTRTWDSISGVTVEEIVVSYSSASDARTISKPNCKTAARFSNVATI